MGDETSGFTGNYTNLVNGFETTRDNVLANYPNTVYDPSVLDPLLVQAVIDGAQSDFEDNIAPLIGVYQTNTALIEGDYQDAVQDAWDDFADDMVTATNTRQQRYTDADNDFETAMSGPRSTYADNMADILILFNDDIAAAVADRTDDYTTAQDDYETAMTPVIAAYEDDVDAAQQEYEEWENGVGPNNALTSATWTRVKTENTSTSPATITWKVNGVISTIADNISWGGSTSSKEPQPPTGNSLQPGSPTIVVTGSITTTTEVYVKTSPTAPDGIRANPYEMALFARFEAYANQLDGINEVYTTVLNDAQQDRTAAIDAANAQYLTTVYGNSTGASPYATGSPADVFFSAMDLAQQGFNGTEASEWQDYTDAVYNYYTTLFSQMSANYYMLSPNPAILGGFAQTYLVNALNAAIDYTEAVGAAWVTFVGQERAADSLRDQGLVQAEYDAAFAQENAANAADQGAIGAWASFAGDFLGINAGYTIKRAGKQKDRDQRIADAGQTLLLAHNDASEIKAHKEVLADKNYADKEAVAWDDRWQAEAVDENTLTKAEAGAEETRIGDRGVAGAYFAKDGALAAHTRDTALIQAEVNRGTDLATEELTLATGALGFVPQLFTDVATGIDALYTNYFSNDPNQTAVIDYRICYCAL